VVVIIKPFIGGGFCRSGYPHNDEEHHGRHANKKEPAPDYHKEHVQKKV
jgi:hypothetical protein